MKYSAALFDLDGTLLDSIGGILAAVNHCLSEWGYPTVSRQQTIDAIGNGPDRLIHLCLPQPDALGDRFEEGLKQYNDYYLAHTEVDTDPFPGILPMLKDLRAAGIKTGILSNKPDDATKKLARIYFDGALDLARGSREGVRLKPAPDALFAAAEQFGVPVADLLYVGDMTVDVRCGHAAGADVAAVTWGFGSTSALAEERPTYLVASPEELESILLYGRNG